jgi:type VI secretion system secreted protein VgrG
VLCDDRASHKAVPDYEEVKFRPQFVGSPGLEPLVSWRLDQEVSTGSYSVNDYDFESPRADLLARREHALPHANDKLEQYDPLAGFVDSVDAGNGGDSHRSDRGEHYARVRLEEHQAAFERIWTEGIVRGPHAGALFELTDHPRGDQNREYLVVRGEYDLSESGYDATSASGVMAAAAEAEEPRFVARFQVQAAEHPFRPRRVTPRPVIPGPHTATVVGDGEIWTDSYGRVKVHFPWDRENAEGCWVRVAQVWAGAGWGALYVPRVGQEVLVEFIEGDPDRPIIMGRVYNASNPPPFELPDGATQSGILSRSSKDGTKENANEIRFQDKKGEEMLFLHAEKNQTIEVENDEVHSVGNDRTKTVAHDETVEVKNNRTETVGADESITISGNRKESVAKDESVSVSGARTVSVSKDDSLSVDGSRSKNISKDERVDVGASRSERVGKDESITIGGKRTESVAKDETVDVGQNRAHTIGKNDVLDVAKKLHIKAGDEISIEAGSAKIVLKKDGTIQIQGANISVKGSGTVALKGSSVTQN